ncbi:CBS domain-containing protein CBSCBSPB3-like [Iris pallida]|uniref:CBS domain-containing protein CBSCBSPB3-like n=1 Tax=Iris pallida TaxID=29817 RepID=A0AAX6FPC8_IRIPA|nr:CBS domain-containing protein CBSCBSPB3-like [Iris pallida]KAJ6818180.1 CBS domain-containing protein CBSCBSPB3-like [Iris pallida]
MVQICWNNILSKDIIHIAQICYSIHISPFEMKHSLYVFGLLMIPGLLRLS